MKTFLLKKSSEVDTSPSKFAEVHSNFSAVHYKPTEDRQSKMSFHIVIQNDDFLCLALDQKGKDQLFDKNCE